MGNSKVYIYGDSGIPVVDLCTQCVHRHGMMIVPTAGECDVALAPLLTIKLELAELRAPRLGTLIFHPSLLPRHRGRDAIKWAFRCKETYSGATWFWADNGFDTGAICEQEILSIDQGESPRDFYSRAVIPSAVRLLGYILEDLKNGVVRKRPQMHEYATYEPPIVHKQ